MAGLTLKRPDRPRALISLVPMIDVMLILLVFFMVTSTYLNLDMIPAARRGADAPAASDPAAGGGASVMVRIGSDGVAVFRGQRMTAANLTRQLSRIVSDDPLVQVLILPSTVARTQALISVMEAVTQSGVARLRVVRLEAGQ